MSKRKRRIIQLLRHLKIEDTTNLEWVIEHLEALMVTENIQGQLKYRNGSIQG